MIARRSQMDGPSQPIDLDGIDGAQPWMQFVWPAFSWDRCGTRARKLRMNADPEHPGTVCIEIDLDDGETVCAMIRSADLMRFVAHAIALSGDKTP